MKNQRRNSLAAAGLLAILLSVFLFASPPLFSQVELREKHLDTDGDTRGLALRDHYVFLAEGRRGFKIINVRNPYRFIITGSLAVPGSFIDKLAVNEKMAVLADPDNRLIHFVDITDLMRPELKATLATSGDKPRRVRVDGEKAYVVERGDDPRRLGYFAGIEVFSCGRRMESLQLTGMKGVQDVLPSGDYLLAAAGNRIKAFPKSSRGFNTTEDAVLDLPAGQEIQSLSQCGRFIFAISQDKVYALAFFTLHLPFFIESPFLAWPRLRFIRVLSTIAEAPVPGVAENRKVSSAIFEYGGGRTSEPVIYVLVTTQGSYGMLTFDPATRALTPVSITDLVTAASMTMRDVSALSGGGVRIYDSALPLYFYSGLTNGGIVGFGAGGEFGLGFVQANPRH